MRGLLQRAALVMCGCFLYPLASSAQPTVYVDDTATGTNDGSSWCDAFVFLQNALSAASASGGAITEIRVAEGEYRPDRSNANPGGTADRLASFVLVGGVAVKGGYAGCGSPDPDARNVAVYDSVLTGDLLGNDGPNFANYGDNSYHVVTYNLSGVTNVVIDGFTVRGGYADGTGPAGTNSNQGGAIHIRDDALPCISGGPTIRNCTIRDNWALHHGAVNDHAWNTVIENCSFLDNVAGQEGAGLLVHSGSAIITDCLFEGNTVGLVADEGEGGGAWLGHDTDPSCPAQHQSVFTDCVFRANRSLALGAGAFGDVNSDPRFEGCSFENNTAGFSGGGAYVDTTINGSDQVTAVDCTFSGNDGGAAGGGLFTRRATLNRCTFSDNRADNGAGMYNVTYGPSTVTDSLFLRNVSENAGHGGGILNHSNGGMLVRDSVFHQNSTNQNGGAIESGGDGLTVLGCLFLDNDARLGGGVHVAYDDFLVMTGTRFLGNTAEYGGGLYLSQSAGMLANCLFTGNSGNVLAGAMLTGFTDLQLVNSTLNGNTSASAGGIYSQSLGPGDAYGPLAIHNSILWGNSDNGGSGEAAQVLNSRDEDTTVYFSNVQGWTGNLTGAGNIDADPQFVDANGADDILGTDDDNLRLTAGSPSVNTADNSAVPEGLTTDLDGFPRIENGTVDMGAYERGDCGNEVCAGAENPCNCEVDCGPPPTSETTCDDGIDEDCDALTDCTDPDCAGGPICPPICQCDANVNDYGGILPVAFPDLAAIADCMNGDCVGCVRDCDVNCDGTVDGADLGAAVCHFQAGTGSGGECCDVPSGACVEASGSWPACFETSEAACDLFSGTYSGDGSGCLAGTVGGIPTVSQWGLVILTLLLAAAGSVVVRTRHATV